MRRGIRPSHCEETIMKRLGSLPKIIAWLLAAAMIFAAVFVIGGLKLYSKYRGVEKTFDSKVNTPDSSGNTFAADYSRALGFAKSIADSASEVLGDIGAKRQLNDAFSAAKAAEGSSSASYKALMELYPAVCTAYNAVEASDAEAARSIRGAYSNFLSGYTVIANSYGEAYNEYTGGIRAIEGGFPSTAIKKLWGIN